MCDQCTRLNANIDAYNAFLKLPLDPLTAERVTEAVGEMTSRRILYHLPERPPCSECQMRMIATKRPIARRQTFECFRCGHILTCSVEETAEQSLFCKSF